MSIGAHADRHRRRRQHDRRRHRADLTEPLPGRPTAPRCRSSRQLCFKLKGGTNRGDHPAFAATLRPGRETPTSPRPRSTLPHSEFLDQDHIRTVCTRVQFAAEGLPGRARSTATQRRSRRCSTTPLEGPVYLRSSSTPAARPGRDLNGQIDVDLVGRIDSINGRSAPPSKRPRRPGEQIHPEHAGRQEGPAGQLPQPLQERSRADVQDDRPKRQALQLKALGRQRLQEAAQGQEGQALDPRCVRPG